MYYVKDLLFVPILIQHVLELLMICTTPKDEPSSLTSSESTMMLLVGQPSSIATKGVQNRPDIYLTLKPNPI